MSRAGITPLKADRGAARDVTEIKGAKTGKRVFLLGNGPPLHEWTMAEIKALGADTIGMNQSWRPSPDGKHEGFQGTTLHCFISGAHAYALCDGKVKTGHVVAPRTLTWLIDAAECGCRCTYSFVGVLSGGASPTAFSFDLDRGIMTKFAGYFAIQLAAWCGYDEIYLLGYSAQDREGHAFDEDPSKGPITRGGMRRWFQGAQDWAAAKSRPIFNCDPESAIECFPKLSKDEVIARIQAVDAEESAL